MGQLVMAVMLGCNVPKGVRLFGDFEKHGEEWVYEEGLIDDKWKKAAPRSKLEICTDADYRVLGILILGANDDHADPIEQPVALNEIKRVDPYRRVYRKARNRWLKFTRWADAQGVTLEPAKLYLVRTEVA